MKRLALVLLCVSAHARAQTAEPEPEPEVQVTGEQLSRSNRDPTAASTVITGEPLREPGIDAARLLARVPGVQTTRSGSSADLTTLSLRGSSAAQVPVYLAGIRVQDEVTGVADLSRFPLWMLERIEIYRGTSPEFVPRFGLAGAVLLEPRMPRHNEARAGVELGSWNSQSGWGGATVANAPASRGVQAATSASYRLSHSDNDFTYRDDAGTAFSAADDGVALRQNADFVAQDFWSLSRFVVPTSQGPVRANVVLNGFAREQGVTGLSQTPAQRARMATTRELAGLDVRLPCQGGDGRCSLQLATRGVSQQQVTRDPWDELGLGTDFLALGSERLETRASLRLRPRDALLWGLDVAFENGRLDLNQPQLARTRAQERIVSGTGLVQLEHGEFQTLALVRGSCLDVRGSEFERATSVDSCFFEGRWGGKWAVGGGFTLRSNAQRAVRPATLGERYGVSAGTRGNADLLPEQGWSFDTGVNYVKDLGPLLRLDAELFGFARFAEQLIAYQRAALGYVRPYNVAESRTLGVEFAANVVLLSHLRLGGQLTALDPRDTSAGRTTINDLIPLLSRLTVGGEIEVFTENRPGLWSRAGLTWLLRYRGGRVADPAGLIVVPGQLVSDLTCAFQFWENRLALRARLENLFDTSQFDTVGYPLPGRSFYSSLELIY